MIRLLRSALPLVALLASAVVSAQHAAHEGASTAILPPPVPWNGASRSLMVKAGDPWITPAEESRLERTPRYDETVAWLRKLTAATPLLRMVSIGRSDEGRNIWMVVASSEGAFTPDALAKSKRPLVLAQGGIHAGEIDGKDAGMMLLRDMTVRNTKRALLDGANFLFIPILNVDGHERFSKFSRINQRGPVEMGWRATSRNLNVNRDFTKLDTPEARAVVRVFREWNPHLFLDLHVTDGIDYQYDITFGWTGRHGFSPSSAAWIEQHLAPRVNNALSKAGHVPGPLIFAIDPLDLSKGIVDWWQDPRFSNGYGDITHTPAILVENHSLKPYDQRVLGTYILLEETLRAAAASSQSLVNAIAEDRARRVKTLGLTWKASETNGNIEFLGVESKLSESPVSGTRKVEYTGRPVTMQIPHVRYTTPVVSVQRPAAYWIHPAWPHVIERIRAHGIRMETLSAPMTLDLEMDRVSGAKLEPRAFEGRARVTATPVPERRRSLWPAGSVRVPTDQPLGDLAVFLLDPRSPDSFFQWGFFLEILNRTEYVEGYVMEPMAERMLAANPRLAKEFAQRLESDEAFRNNPNERLLWFYRQTPFYDERESLYPVGRE